MNYLSLFVRCGVLPRLISFPMHTSFSIESLCAAEERWRRSECSAAAMKECLETRCVDDGVKIRVYGVFLSPKMELDL
jgi:hypothetical protein